MLTDIWLEEVKLGDGPEDQGVAERKLFEWILKKEIWNSLATNGPVSDKQLNFGVSKMRKMFLPTEVVVACRQFYCIDWVIVFLDAYWSVN